MPRCKSTLTAIVLIILANVQFQPMLNASEIDENIKNAFSNGELDGLHSVLVMLGSDTLAETYFPGDDERWGQSLGMQQHSADTLHDIRSVTKPIVGLLYGIALEDGLVPDLNDPLLTHFPEYPDLQKEPERQKILVEHVLSMTMGIKWNENLPYTDPTNSEIAMELAEDRYRYVLEQPLTHEPGARWVYNGGALAVAAKLISDGVGMPLDKYADIKLFKPLGITNYDWIRGADNVPSAASGLRLKTHDLAKIGQLINQNGEFQSKQIIPKDWLTKSFTPYSNLEDGLRYGLFWWLAPWGDPPAWVAGFGNGGQRLTVQPEIDLIIVIYAGNYNEPDAWKVPVKIIEEFIVPEVKDHLAKKQ